MNRNRGTLTAVLTLLVVAVGLVMACGEKAEQSVYTEADSGRTVEVSLGDSVTLRLVENASTGYGWTEEHSAGLEMQTDRFVSPPASPAVVGAAGAREYSFRAAAVGTQTIAAVYARPWEKAADDQGRKVFTLTIEVSD